MVDNETPKVSVIVPMYNVGSYAKACLASLTGQSYENLEIIVVDDGSTDDTSEICLSVSKDDNRVAVVRKSNGGLSSARNYGLSKATGDYVTFVDGDDVLDKRAIDCFVHLAQKNNAPLVACRYKKIRSTARFDGGDIGSNRIVSGDQLLDMMLTLNGESGSACAKLYSKDLFQLLLFPEGQLFEDFGVEAKLFSAIDRACVVDAELYGYLTREGSITTKKGYGDAQLEGMEASLDVLRSLVADNPRHGEAFRCYEAFSSLRVASRLDLKKCSDVERAKVYIDKAKKRCRAASKSKQISKTWRIRCALFSVSPGLHNLVYYLYGMFTGKVVG